MATIADHLRTFLIAEGLGRDPRVAGATPPIWRQPAEGTPAPGEKSGTEVGPTVVLGLVHSGGIPAPRHEVEWRRDIVDIWIRTLTWPQAEQTYAGLRSALVDKRNWLMGSITVIESLEWRALALLASDGKQGYTSQAAVLFESYAVDHF